MLSQCHSPYPCLGFAPATALTLLAWGSGADGQKEDSISLWDQFVSFRRQLSLSDSASSLSVCCSPSRLLVLRVLEEVGKLAGTTLYRTARS